jgi:hypothetical protein
MRGGEGYDFFARDDRFRFFFVFSLSLFCSKIRPFNSKAPLSLVSAGPLLTKRIPLF